jgi:hypothetical protein
MDKKMVPAIVAFGYESGSQVWACARIMNDYPGKKSTTTKQVKQNISHPRISRPLRTLIPYQTERRECHYLPEDIQSEEIPRKYRS